MHTEHLKLCKSLWCLVVQLLMFRTAGIVIPVYISLISVTTLLHRCNQQQVCGIQAHFNLHSDSSFTNNVKFHENAGCARDAGFRTSWSRGFAANATSTATAYHQHPVGSCTAIHSQAGSVNI
jgi:hypothetical protein